MGLDKSEPCVACGRIARGPSSNWAVVDGILNCERCAVRASDQYEAGTACSMCRRLFMRHEIKMVLPSSAYFDGRADARKRLMCTGCYRNITAIGMIRVRRPLRQPAAARVAAYGGLGKLAGRMGPIIAMG